MTKYEVIEIARKHIQSNMGGCWDCDIDVADDLLYEQHVDNEVRRMLVEIAMTEGNFATVVFSSLVNKQVYRQVCVNEVHRGDLQPNELNRLRCEAVEKANSSMEDVYGHDDFALVKIRLNVEIRRVSMQYLYDHLKYYRKNCCMFLWFDLEGRNNGAPEMPQIEW